MSDSLYGIKQASKTKAKEISSSTSLAFSTSLASLISSSSSGKSKLAGAGRALPTKDKSDIFTAHNKNVKKRAAADLEDDGSQRHKTKDDIGSVDAADLHRAKRKMEDKVRIYNAMKRGEYIGRDDYDDRLVDFDRKWAEGQADGGEADASDNSDDEDSGSDGGEEVEYLDEFGRLRKGTKAQAEREERRKRMQVSAAEEQERMSARPSMPTNVIYGDTVQHAAFNPDQVIADRMAEISKKRDKSATPPPETHYDANAEVRTRGTGFYTFSKDEDERKKEMDALEKERQETERARKEREEKKEQRKKEIEERRRLIAEQKAKARTEKFLDNLQIDGL